MIKRIDTISKIESILRLFPEVKWDRWSGEIDYFIVYGWIKRKDTHEDFITIKFDSGEATEMMTSSAKYSADFGKRLGFIEGMKHNNCKRVEHTFDVDCIKLEH